MQSVPFVVLHDGIKTDSGGEVIFAVVCVYDFRDRFGHTFNERCIDLLVFFHFLFADGKLRRAGRDQHHRKGDKNKSQYSFHSTTPLLSKGKEHACIDREQKV